jgi:hypothetical protein
VNSPDAPPRSCAESSGPRQPPEHAPAGGVDDGRAARAQPRVRLAQPPALPEPTGRSIPRPTAWAGRRGPASAPVVGGAGRTAVGHGLVPAISAPDNRSSRRGKSKNGAALPVSPAAFPGRGSGSHPISVSRFLSAPTASHPGPRSRTKWATHSFHHDFVPAGIVQRYSGSHSQRHSPPPGRCGQA